MLPLNQMRIAITVLAISKDKYNATVMIALGEPGTKGYEERIEDDVFITGLAKWYFNNDDRFVIGYEYASANCSKNWNECPLAVIRTCSIKTGKLMYILQMVQQDGEKEISSTTPNGNIVSEKMFKNKSKYSYRRYTDWYDKNYAKYLDNKLKEEEAQAEIDAEAIVVDGHDDLPF
jgi:hypothetical protein